MSDMDAAPVYLRRIDPSQNMQRFYTLSLQPTLFGGASLIRTWGRIGTCGQQKMETFEELRAAAAAFERLQHVKHRRGYREPEISGTE